MRYQCPLLVVRELERSKQFYKNLLGLEVVVDFGANVTLTGGIALQTLDSWTGLIDRPLADISFSGLDSELYFEETDFDGFLSRLERMADITYLHRVVEHPWGQRVVRLLDPDGHIIEVGEELAAVVRRFRDSGLSAEQTASRMDVPLQVILECEK